MSRPTINVGIHVEADTHIGTVDHTALNPSPFVAVQVGDADSTHGVVVYLRTHVDAVRLLKAAEEAASFLAPRKSVA